MHYRKNIFEQRNAAEDEISAAHYIIMCDSFLNVSNQYTIEAENVDS